MPARRLRNARLAAAAAVCVLALPAAALASGSAPVLTLSGGDAFVASDGARGVVATGSFNFEDRLQFGFPIGLMLVQGDRVVRYDVAGTITSTASPLVADGVVVGEIPALLTLTGPAAPPAAVIQVRPDRIVVALPPEIGAGPAVVFLYAEKESESFMSNVVTLELP